MSIEIDANARIIEPLPTIMDLFQEIWWQEKIQYLKKLLIAMSEQTKLQVLEIVTLDNLCLDGSHKYKVVPFWTSIIYRRTESEIKLI